VLRILGVSTGLMMPYAIAQLIGVLSVEERILAALSLILHRALKKNTSTMDCLLEPVGMPASEIHLGHSQTRAIATRILALSSPCSSLLLLTDTNLTALGHAGALSRALVVALDQMEGKPDSINLPPYDHTSYTHLSMITDFI
jgi:hypothetical protein